jgi:hypothetical protein
MYLEDCIVHDKGPKQFLERLRSDQFSKQNIFLNGMPIVIKDLAYGIISLRTSPDDDDVYLEYYSGKGLHINYSCLHVLRKTHKLVQ